MPRQKLTLMQILKMVAMVNLLIGFTGLVLRFGFGFSIDPTAIALSFAIGVVWLILARIKAL